MIHISNSVFYRDHYSNDPLLTINAKSDIHITDCLFTTKDPIGHVIFREPGTGPCILIK